MRRRVAGAAIGLVLTATPSILEAQQTCEGSLPVDDRAPGTFVGVPLQVTYDTSNKLLIVATLRNLYVRDLSDPTHDASWSEVPTNAPARHARILVAAGGRSVAIVQEVSEGLFDFELTDLGMRHSKVGLTSRPATGTLEAREFREIHLGHDGESILTGLPLEDPSGNKGPWRWTFYPRGSKQGATLEVPEPTRVLVDARGGAFALLGSAKATVFDGSGKILQAPPGHFVKGSIADHGRIALLRDADRPTRILCAQRNVAPKEIDAEGPIYGLRLSASGHRAVAWFANAVVSEMDPENCTLTSTLRLSEREPALITSIELQDDGLLTAGYLVKEGGAQDYDAGRVAQIRQGRLLWCRGFDTRTISATVPRAIAVGTSRVALWNFEGVSLLTLSGGSPSVPRDRP